MTKHNINIKFIEYVIKNYSNPANVIRDNIPGLKLKDAKQIVNFYK